MGGGTPSNTTQQTTQQLPEYAQPYATQLLQRGSELSNQPFQPFQGPTVAGLTPEHQAAIGMIDQRAIQGSPVQNAANQNLAGTLSGQYMSPGSNPYLADTFNTAASNMADQYARGISAQTMGQFAQNGAFGGSAMQETQGANNRAFADSLGALEAQTFGANYTNERGNQMRAAGLAPQAAAGDFQNAQALLGSGDIQRQYSQDLINQQLQNYMAQKNLPYQQLDVLGSTLRQSIGAGGTTTQTGPNPYQVNRTANALGLAGVGSGIGSAAYGGTGAGYGAALGGIAGLLA